MSTLWSTNSFALSVSMSLDINVKSSSLALEVFPSVKPESLIIPERRFVRLLNAIRLDLFFKFSRQSKPWKKKVSELFWSIQMSLLSRHQRALPIEPTFCLSPKTIWLMWSKKNGRLESCAHLEDKQLWIVQLTSLMMEFFSRFVLFECEERKRK